jgi:hypothetical protein
MFHQMANHYFKDGHLEGYKGRKGKEVVSFYRNNTLGMPLEKMKESKGLLFLLFNSQPSRYFLFRHGSMHIVAMKHFCYHLMRQDVVPCCCIKVKDVCNLKGEWSRSVQATAEVLQGTFSPI